MRKSELFDKCVDKIERLLQQRKLHIRSPYRCKAQHYFVAGSQICSAITISTFDGEAGIVTRAWGTLFIDPDKQFRCTEIHTSFYSENVALGKLLQELEAIGLNA